VIVVDGDVVQGDAEMLPRLRGDPRFNDVRVIVASLEDRASGLPWGADDFVSKPFRVPELLGRVRTQLKASGQLRDARAALRDAANELDRARGDAVNNRRLIDILHEVTGDLTAAEIYGILTLRVATPSASPIAPWCWRARRRERHHHRRGGELARSRCRGPARSISGNRRGARGRPRRFSWTTR
jgi:CheY-like chemotaxis protein